MKKSTLTQCLTMQAILSTIYNERNLKKMATLRKIEEPSTQKETYAVTVESSIDMFNFKNTYSTMSPETDIIVQLLVYAHDNN